MFDSQLIILIIVFVVFVVIDSWKPFVADVCLMLLFLWGITAFELDTLQLVFYPLALLFYMVIRLNKNFQVNATSGDLDPTSGKLQVKGFAFQLAMIGIGFVMLGIMSAMYSAKGQFIGAPSLAIAGNVKSVLTSAFSPAISGGLGIIENRMIIGVYSVLSEFQELIPMIVEGTNKIIQAVFFIVPFLGPLVVAASAMIASLLSSLVFILPFVLAATVFSLFHLVIYKLAFALLLNAMFVMGMWLGSYVPFKDDTGMNTAHYFWNGVFTLKESVGFAFLKAAPKIVGG